MVGHIVVFIVFDPVREYVCQSTIALGTLQEFITLGLTRRCMQLLEMVAEVVQTVVDFGFVLASTVSAVISDRVVSAPGEFVNGVKVPVEVILR
jgi:hypothetical protein